MDNTEKIKELIKTCELKYNKEYHQKYYKKNKLKLRDNYYKKKDEKMKLKINAFKELLAIEDKIETLGI